MNTQKAVLATTKYINELKSPLKVISDPAVANQLITKFSQIYRVSPAYAQQFFERERDNFGKLITQSDALRNCSPMSIYNAFGTVMKLRLSFDNGKEPLIYLIPGNRNIGTRDQPQWISEVVAQPSPLGEKEVRLNFGILAKVGQPEVVHEGDVYEEYLDDNTGQKVVKWKATNKSLKIVGSFIRLVEPDGTIVFKTFKLSDIDRWMKASDKKNRGKGANPLYTAGIDNQIDESFLKGKTLTHSFKGYKQLDFNKDAGKSNFVPDTSSANLINPGMDIDDVLNDELGEGGVEYEQYEDQPKDEFAAGIAEIEAEKNKVKEGVKVDVDEDNPFK